MAKQNKILGQGFQEFNIYLTETGDCCFDLITRHPQQAPKIFSHLQMLGVDLPAEGPEGHPSFRISLDKLRKVAEPDMKFPVMYTPQILLRIEDRIKDLPVSVPGEIYVSQPEEKTVHGFVWAPSHAMA